MDLEEKLSDLLDDTGFQSIDRHMARFNLFEAVGSVRGELRHSNFLAFLLSPSRAHGLGAEPLHRTLRAILSATPRHKRPLNILELVVGDLDGAVVYREWSNIDLLIEVKPLRLVVLIENKIDSGAGEGQLARYKEIVRNRYPDHRHVFVFLTPEGVDPEDVDYVAFSYFELANVIARLADDRDRGASPDASVIIRHYVEMLRRHIVPDEQLRALALQIYERHKEAFDFVFECRPEPESLAAIAASCLDRHEELVQDRHGSSILRFIPKEWTEVPAFNACDPAVWTRTGRSLIFEIKVSNTTGRVIVALVSGPAPAATREKIYTQASASPKVFRSLVKPMGRQYATIYSRELLTATAAQDMDLNEKAAAIEAGWAGFVADDLPVLTRAVIDIVDT